MIRLSNRIKANLENRLTQSWQRRGLLAWTLLPFALGFAGLAALRRAAFARQWRKVEQIGVPVVVVGNLTVGGTGKTPTVIALVKALQQAGFKPGVISRGYGARVLVPTPVTSSARATEVGDEPLLIAHRTGAPVWVCPDRVAAARALHAAHPELDVLISDDGLQHYQLGRHCEIVVFDHRLGGNGLPLPAGPLREPLTRRRDATVINGLLSPSGLLPNWPNTFSLTLSPGDPWHLDHPSHRLPLTQFTGQRLAAAAGIGAPERFFAMLHAVGLTPITRALPDHYAFTENPFTDLEADAILITEKDAVKCQAWRQDRQHSWHDKRLWAVPIDAMLDPRLISVVVEKVRGCSPT